MLDERVWLAVPALNHPTCVFLCAGHLRSYVRTQLCVLVRYHFPITGPCPNCNSIKACGIKLSKMHWYSEAQRVPFSRIEALDSTPKNQPSTMIPSSSDLTLDTVNPDHSPVNCQSENHPSVSKTDRVTISFINDCRSSLHA